MRRTFLVIIFLLSVSLGLSDAQGYDAASKARVLRFSHITTRNSGLSYDGVRCMMRDSRGYVWIGTQKGLSRYDGARFKLFDRKDFHVDSDYVNSLCEDCRGNVLIGTDRGVVLYNHESDSMSPLEGLSCRVYTMCSDGGSRIFLGVKSEDLYVYDADGGTITSIRLVNPDGEPLRDIYRIVIAKDNTMYLAAYCDNLFKVSLRNLESVVEVEKMPYVADMFDKDDVEGLAVNPKNANLLYVLSQENGLVEVNHMASSARVLMKLPENVFPTTLQYYDGRLWATSSLGLYEYDPLTGNYLCYTNDASDRYSLSDDYTTCLMYSDEGRSIWVGTSGGGINVYSSASEDFRKYYRMSDGTSLEGCNARCIAEDYRGRLWVGTENTGLLYAERGSTLLRNYGPGDALGAVKALMVDGNRMWIGTNKGLWLLDLATGRLQQPVSSTVDNPLYNRRILDLLKGSDGMLYVGTAVGAYIYDPHTRSTDKIEGTGIDAIEDIAEDYSGTIWMATYSNGIYSYNSSGDKGLAHYCSKYDDSPVPEMVSSLSLDNDGNLWVIGFSSGLLKYDMETCSFSACNKAVIPSFPSDLFYSCLHDDMGNLWLSSDAGLVLFNPERRSVKVYEESSGLLENSMRAGHLRLSSGELAFGFNSGLVSFDPQRILDHEKVNRPVVTDVYTHGKKVLAEDGIISRNAGQMTGLEFNAQQRSFAFDFAVPQSGLFVKYNLFCMLEGHDSTWRDVTVPKSVHYHNVPSGEYRLRIKTASATNEEESHHYPVRIVVNPPFFQSALGVITIISMFIVLALVIFYIIRKREKKRAERKREEYEKKREEQILSEKMDFLSNIANDIKTPLTLMKTPLANLSGMETLADNQDLQTVISETDMLDSMTGDLLDYIRAEENGYILQKRSVDIVEKVGFVCVNFKEVFEEKSIRLKFASKEKQLIMPFDTKAIGKVLTSIMNYVSGYAVSMVDVTMEKNDKELSIKVKYDTYPVGERHAEFMFKPFSQYASTRSIGIGLSYARTLVQIHGGDLRFTLDSSSHNASFCITLPIEMPKEQEIVRRDEVITNSSLPMLLIVEGNSKLLSYMKKHLKKSFNILSCSSAEEALQFLITWDIDLIVSDLGLPGMNGMELCSKIKANNATSHIPFVVIAASMPADVRLSCMKKGASQCIEMPFSMDYLKACIDNVLENRSRVKSHAVQLRQNLAEKAVNIVDRDEAFLEKFDSLIMENIANPDFTVKEMEQKLGFSKSSFNRKVNALLGMSPNEYLRQRRLALAAQMLGRKNSRVSDICYRVGFNSPSYFAKCFKEQYGVLPAEYTPNEDEK